MARRRALLRAAAAAGTAAVLAGCATVPTVGPPAPVAGSSGPAQQFVQPIPPQPTPTWSAEDVVQGFLAASASFHSPAALRFLAPELRKSWRQSWAVTVVASGLALKTHQFGPSTVNGTRTEVDTVSLTGQRLATISSRGQYLDQPGSQSYEFRLVKVHGQWLIRALPRTSTLLTQAAFEQVYQPRNLYFWSPAIGQAGAQLIPEPVFAPETDTLPDVAKTLVKALLPASLERGGWLATATGTAFPAGTKVLGVSITDANAVVNLGGVAAAASQQQLGQMAAQLTTTLTGTSYGQSPISRSVTLEIQGRVVQQAASYNGLIPQFPATAQKLYFLGSSGAVSELSGGSHARVVPGPLGHAQIPFSMIAVSLPSGSPQLAGTLATGPGCVVYYGGLAGPPLAHRALPHPADGRCVSLSWDRRAQLWAVTAHRIWLLPPGVRQPVPVSLPALPGSDPQSYRILALRVALDGVRVAMLVQTQGGKREILMTAATRAGRSVSLGPAVTVGTSLASPAALSWYDPDDLIVLAGSGLYVVPVNGGAPQLLKQGVTNSQVITSAGPSQIAVGGDGGILVSSGLNQIQQPAVKGTSPAYPG